MRRAVRLELFQAGAPELDRADEHALLQFIIACGDLDDALIEKPVFAVIFEPDLFERLVTFEEKPAVELFDAFIEARVGVHVWGDFR